MEQDTSSKIDSLPHSDSNASLDNVELDEPRAPETTSENEDHIVEDDTEASPTPESTNGQPIERVEQEPIEEPIQINGDNAIHTNESEPVVAPPIPPKVEQPVEGISVPRESTSEVKPTETPNDSRQDFRVQSPSLSVASGNPHKRSMTISKGHNVSMVLITSALETIASSKEARRSTPLRESTQKALDLIRSNQGGDRPREIFEPLRLACETRNEKLMIASLDCISKLISYSFFTEDDQGSYALPSPPPSPNPARNRSSGGSQGATPLPSLVDLVANTITSCHTETTPDSVSLQIVKALLSLVLSPSILVHHSSLLKAVRTVYNIFLLSTDPVNQMVAQGGLTQMVHHVFSRCRRGNVKQSSSETNQAEYAGGSQLSSARESFALSRSELDTRTSVSVTTEGSHQSNGSAEKVPGNGVEDSGSENKEEPQPPLTLQSFEAKVPIDVHPEEAHSHHHLTLDDLFVKDAFLVFRALCKLTMKPLNTESERDLKSHGMRSRLLSLQLVLTVLNSHMPLFVDPTAIIYSSSNNEATGFVQAINQYLCLCLSRNAVSPIPQVFEISVEIFWRVLSGMRTKLKKEIEVLLHEIFIPILEMKTSTLKQKAVILGMLSRLCQDPQALVEMYLNYDCDSEAADNIYEHLMNIISKFGTAASLGHPQRAPEPPSPALSPTPKNQGNAQVTWNVSGLTVPGTMDTSTMGLSEGQLRRQGLECLVAVLRSLVAWGTSANKSSDEGTAPLLSARSHTEESKRDPVTPEANPERLSVSGQSVETFRQGTPDYGDDPTKFESAKQKKTTLLEGIKKFNYKPKRGVQFLIETGFIPSNSPQDIAKFILNTDGLNKSVIGEYLGEGDEENIAIMHAFVDYLEFRDIPFVEALRTFLQSFRLPGESQKIDRFMLKFAERYIAGNAKTPFASAESAYVLAYSVVMLNTDAHNPQIKKRMTKADFLKNNRGINEGADLPEEFLSQVFDDIVNNEIRMKDEVEAGLTIQAPGPGLANAIASVGRDLQKEAYVMQSNGMANKTEALFRTMMRTQRKGSKGGDQYFSASHFVHVRPMFEVAWIPFLAGLSGPLQETDDLEVVELCLDGFRNAIRIVCFFDLELQRNAFVTTLAKFTFLNNLGEMKTKNMEAIKALLDVAVTEGNNLKGSWHEVLTCVSQLEHMQLIGTGADLVEGGKKGRSRKVPTEELANESRSTHITVAADMVFSLSHYLSGTAIVDFVQALCDVSWEEIQSSGLSQHPRLFSLQKLVDISYYNMTRIRLEWSNLWDILGEHFNLVCCHNNPHVASFALDSLRQLAMRFLEKEELPHFKFQKDFLKPFEYTMTHNQNPDIRDLVLQCLQQMIQARSQNLRSGWRTMFGVFSAASKVLTERVANSAFEIITRINKDHFNAIVQYGAFADLTVCITEFCKVSKYQKISLLAIAMLRGVIPVMLQSPVCALNTEVAAPDQPMDDTMIKFWFPVLFGFYDIIMNGEDLEVRRLALDSLFSTLKTYGATYPVEFWDTVCQELLFPIFAVLKSSQDLSRFSTQEDMSVWLSTTMIQALRDLIDLYTFYFDILERFLDGLLDLLCVCICQVVENDTLARIGTSCLQQLLENNVKKLSPARWERITATFVRLFRTTTPHQLFDESLRVEIDSSSEAVAADSESNGVAILPAPLSPNNETPKVDVRASLTDRRRIFKQIIVKCVLQLLLIETTNDLLRNDDVYNTIPPTQLLRMMSVLDQSYQFARSFNEDKDLRTGLWKVGFMKHLPNLLKQESSSAATLVHVLLRMYHDTRPEHQAARPQIAERLVPLGVGVLRDFNKLKADTQSKMIQAWTPVVAATLDGFCRFDRQDYLTVIYPLATDLLSRDIAPEVREPLKTYFERVGYVKRIIDTEP
ncbi:Protein transport protein sec71 [Psilocybe cubensis]|uniref:Protein transport protein sec71 n=1 Tax=Psilocybe cubensis TaxID=181762 RepID=A0ACB8H790_PSICU|nr:Protein transport protein sec71 [Psilocybe cubensis]KAH9483049.1 Protein transport protein sec71 [Psilocybe cubensis]